MRAMRLRPRRRTHAAPAHASALRDEPEHPEPDQGPERELATRESDGLHVALLWDPRDDAVSVAVADRREGRVLRFVVDATRALDAFNHPFVYAP
jgi:hypothetical protein